MIKCSDYPTIILAFIFANLGEFELIRFQKSKLFSDEIVEKLSQSVTLACLLWTCHCQGFNVSKRFSRMDSIILCLFFFGGF